MAAAGMIPALRRRKQEEAPAAAPDEPEAENVDPPGGLSSEPEPNESTPEPAPPVVPEFSGKYAVVIGHSAEGGFSDGLDLLFQRLDGVRLAALSDGDPDSLDETYTRAGAPEGFVDYREMLATRSPDLACIAHQGTALRRETIGAALEGGAHVIAPLPLSRTLKEADELLALGKSKSKRIAVTGLLRCSPAIRQFRSELGKLIGELVEIHLTGRGDETSGGEDLLRTGLPLFDLARWFAGEPEFVSAILSQDGMPAIAEDAREDAVLGPLLGDAIQASFTMDTGVVVTFVSDPVRTRIAGSSSAEFVGTKGRARLWIDPDPRFSVLRGHDPDNPSRTDVWKPWNEAAWGSDEADHLAGSAADRRRIVHDWLSAIDGDRDPKCSGANATKALEMAHGIWQAGTTLRRAYFPLVNRLHPLSEESR